MDNLQGIPEEARNFVAPPPADREDLNNIPVAKGNKAKIIHDFRDKKPVKPEEEVWGDSNDLVEEVADGDRIGDRPVDEFTTVDSQADFKVDSSGKSVHDTDGADMLVKEKQIRQNRLGFGKPGEIKAKSQEDLPFEIEGETGPKTPKSMFSDGEEGFIDEKKLNKSFRG